MHPTDYPHINHLLAELRDAIGHVLGDKLIGLYLFGSLVTGDFLEGVSDLDLLAATSGDIDDVDLAHLRAMHAGIVRGHPEWDNRIEVAYYSVDGLRTFRTQRSPLGIISPGEPLHIVSAGEDWLMNWYLVRAGGITLFGPEPTTIIAPVSHAEFIDAIREHARSWGDWIGHMRSRNEQSYAILTMCRALRLHCTGEHVSKAVAADWALGIFPDHAHLIESALRWRTEQPGENDGATLPETTRFVQMIRVEIIGAGS